MDHQIPQRGVSATVIGKKKEITLAVGVHGNTEGSVKCTKTKDLDYELPNLWRAMNWYKRLFSRPPKGLDRNLREVWFAGNVLDKSNLIPYFHRGKYIRYKVGDCVPYCRTEKGVAWYKITKVTGSLGDFSEFDDGKKYDLVFDSVRDSARINIKNGEVEL